MPTQINKLSKINATGMDPVFAQHYSQLIDTVNSLAGHNGPIPLQSHLDMQGNLVQNLGTAAKPSPTDALTHGVAQSAYSAAALKPALQAGGSATLNSYRILNSGTQREGTSSYMNELMSSVPNANLIVPFVSPSGANFLVLIPASPFTFADGSSIMLNAFSDLITALPGSFAITSMSVAGGVVTVNCAATGLSTGDIATIIGGTNASFSGTFQLISSTGGGTVLQYQSSVASGTDTGGFVQVNGVHYYAAKTKNPNIFRFGPFTGDTMFNRMNSNFDGTQIVAVVVITATGAQIAQSGGGGSPIVGSPTAGSFF